MSEGNKTITLTPSQVDTLLRVIEVIQELSNWTPASQDRLTDIWEQLTTPDQEMSETKRNIKENNNDD